MLPPTRRVALLALVLLARCASASTTTADAAPAATPAASAGAAAPSDAGPAAPTATAPQTETDEVFDSAREGVRSTAIWLASGVDSWFGDRPFTEGGKVSDGRLSLNVLAQQGERPSVNVRFNARFRLPNIDRLTYVFVGRDDRQEVITDTPGALSKEDLLQPVSPEDRMFFAGLGRPLNDAVDFRLGVRGGLKLYAQARYRGLWQPGPRDAVDFRQTVFWTLADRIGSTTAASYEHLVSPTLAVRWLSAATITQALPKFVWSSIVGSYKSFGDQRLLSLEALVNGQQGSGVGATDYGVQARWEQPVHQDWLIAGIVVGRFWPRPDVTSVRRGDWALGVSVRMRF